MHSIGSAFYHLKDQLHTLYDVREAAAIAHIIMEHITGLGRADRLVQRERVFTTAEASFFQRALSLAINGTPVQYITGKAWFLGAEYIVNRHVLIPRPETEELVQWIIEDFGSRQVGLQILDVGTGSGCIPISLRLALPGVVMTSCDISNDALAVARQNASVLKADVNFVQLDFLERAQQESLGHYDLIVSNPPYIPVSEREKLHVNVREHEPSQALFVPDEDALVFYRELALFGRSHLVENGSIYCELDADHSQQTSEMFISQGYKNLTLRKDIHGNDRMLVAHNGAS